MPPKVPEVKPPSAFLEAVRETAKDLRDKFAEDPEALLLSFGLQLPRKPEQVMAELGLYDEEIDGKIEPGLREMVLEVCLEEVDSAAAVGPRGGGKSQGVSFIEFFLVFVKMYDALNLGGSELQADQVYQYLLAYIEMDPFWQELVKGMPQQSKTTTQDGAWIRVLTASQKSVRSPHAGGFKNRNGIKRWAGGILVIDEEAEAEAEIVEAALPTINTARPSVNVRCSTFHNAEGSFADLIQNHEEMGYKLYRWTAFDIMERCACGPDGCESSEKCFREDHVETYIDPATGEPVEKLIHKAYCGGKARYAEGWMPVEEAEKLFRRMKRNHARWEVEAMGSRPTTKNHVIKDHVKWATNKTNRSGEQLYVPGDPIEICIDWGTVAAGINVWQQQLDGHALLLAEELHEYGPSEILGRAVELYDQYQECEVIAADIGGGGNYMNRALEDLGITVRDVVFNTEKEAAVAAWNILNEANQIKIPNDVPEFNRQVENWRRKNGRIEKGNDHMCDAGVCYFAKFIEQLGLSHVRVPPRTFATAADAPQNVPQSSASPAPERADGRAPVAVVVGARRR